MIPILYFVVPGFLVLQFFESPSSVVGSTPSLSNIEVMNVRSEDDSTAEAHEREVQAWHDRRIANLKRDHGWLTLIALDFVVLLYYLDKIGGYGFADAFWFFWQGYSISLLRKR